MHWLLNASHCVTYWLFLLFLLLFQACVEVCEQRVFVHFGFGAHGVFYLSHDYEDKSNDQSEYIRRHFS